MREIIKKEERVSFFLIFFKLLNNRGIRKMLSLVYLKLFKNL